ncbi:MAG: lysophospholipid acyltransferase family protein [bacterium]|nr:lysophospholipid acyltransferase family protein [bacterium]
MMYRIYCLLRSFARKCPPECLRVLGMILGYGTYLFNRQQRINVLANLQYILPPKTSLRARKGTARAVFTSFYTYLFEFFSIKALNHDQVGKLMSTGTVELLTRLSKDKQPCILVSAHLGNWEIAAMALDSLGFVNNLIYLPHEDKRTNDLFINNRDYRSTKLVSLGLGLKNAFKGLKKGEILTMVGDWGIGDNNGIEVRFFGRLTKFPCGPAEIAVKTRVPIIPGFAVREGPGKFSIGCAEPITWDRQTTEEEQIKSITQSFASVLEDQVRAHPEQWLIFKQIWP